MRNRRLTETVFSGWFEGEYGEVMFDVKAGSVRQAQQKLAKMYPEDVGADGEMEDENTGKTYYPWPMNESVTRRSKLAESNAADIARKMMALGAKQKDDEKSNLLSKIGAALSEYKTPFGPKNMQELCDRTGCDAEMIKKVIQYTKKNAHLAENIQVMKENFQLDQCKRAFPMHDVTVEPHEENIYEVFVDGSTAGAVFVHDGNRFEGVANWGWNNEKSDMSSNFDDATCYVVDEFLNNSMSENKKVTTKDLVLELAKRTKVPAQKIVESIKSQQKSKKNVVTEDATKRTARVVLNRSFTDGDIVRVSEISEALCMPISSIKKILRRLRETDWTDGKMDAVCWNKKMPQSLAESIYRTGR